MAFGGILLAKILPIGIEWLRGVAPPSIETIVEKLLTRILPIEVACLGTEGIIGICTTNEEATFSEIVGLRRIGERGPNGNHQSRVLGVDAIGKCAFVGEVARVHLHVPPTAWLPIVPILHNHIYGDMLATKPSQGQQQLFAAVVSLLRLRVAKEIARHHGRAVRQPTIGTDGLVHRGSLHKVVIELRGCSDVDAPAVEAHFATCIDEQAVASGGGEHRHHRLEIVLTEIKRLVA